mmetsp:Transcript_16610/g.21078  ORF Transcript_16610/g.21078 Transcript_16610/m.21078 type:complete len:113 (-) Transcript_16610:278-616(-)
MVSAERWSVCICTVRQSGGCGSRNISSAFSHGSSNLSLNESAASKFDECAEIQHALFFFTRFLHCHLLGNHWKEEPMALIRISSTRVTTHPSPVRSMRTHIRVALLSFLSKY